MIRIKKHIALILLGIFFFPIIFQSVHIVWHHSYSFQDDNISRLSSGKTKDVVIIGGSTVDQCPICNYKFAINKLPEFLIFSIFIVLINRRLNLSTIAQPHNQIITINPARAPPYLVQL